MSKIIPVMVHHETGEKAQAAGKKNQEYLKYCIAQAKKYNEKVVLLGDEYNKAWCDDWHNANDFITEKWTKFHAVFENLSTYPTCSSCTVRRGRLALLGIRLRYCSSRKASFSAMSILP